MSQKYKEFYTEEEWDEKEFPPNITIEYSLLSSQEEFNVKFFNNKYTKYKGEGYYLDPITNLRK